MYLNGLGDPTNGHGGLSYVKKPLKSRTEKFEVKDKKIDQKAAVTGTESDLRKLNQADAKQILMKMG